jgi:hypothetical protein
MSDKLKELKKEMILCYGTKCWLSLVENKRLTGHHIIPVRSNGLTVWNNIALLTCDSHEYFNYVERIMPRAARELNELFYELNKTYAPPTQEYEKDIIYVLNKIERY